MKTHENSTRAQVDTRCCKHAAHVSKFGRGGNDCSLRCSRAHGPEPRASRAHDWRREQQQDVFGTATVSSFRFFVRSRATKLPRGAASTLFSSFSVFFCVASDCPKTWLSGFRVTTGHAGSRRLWPGRMAGPGLQLGQCPGLCDSESRAPLCPQRWVFEGGFVPLTAFDGSPQKETDEWHSSRVRKQVYARVKDRTTQLPASHQSSRCSWKRP